MEITRYESPMECDKIVNIWAEIFGMEEALLEKPQIDGRETSYNRDIMFVAYEGEKVVGTIHATFPKEHMSICGLSGMCTHPDVRGTGLGRILFQKIVEETEALGAEYTFLGTGNPLAAKLYHSCGFSFLPGSNVMVRFRNGDRFDMDRRFFVNKPERVQISEGTPSMRIPMIPFVLYRGPHLLMDRNTGILSSDVVTQVSCMGLYPRYMDLSENGGSWYTAFDADSGIPGALLSKVPTEDGIRADFFYTEGFRETAETLLDTFASEDRIYFIVSERDTEKQELLRRKGYQPAGKTIESVREFLIPCIRYIRNLS